MATAATAMRFCSVRGGCQHLTFEDAVLAGWASDGGMILPQALPNVDFKTLARWRNLPYPELAVEVLSLFTDELPALPDIVRRSFSVFGSKDVVTLSFLPQTSAAAVRGGNAKQPAASLWIAELWHGPTLAFKDLGMQILCGVLEHILAKRKDRMCALVSTSGDTGSSAMAGVERTGNLDVIVIYPRGRISRVQEAQMLSAAAASEQCVVASAEGNSDDIDVPCADLLGDAAFKEKHRLGSLNSVNVLRLLAQVTHFFYAYLRLHKEDACWQVDSAIVTDLPTVSFGVPTGAGGHITAGLIAKQMGLPVSKFVVAVNRNDCLDRMIRDGVLQASKFVHHTAAPAMDIAAPYNVERLLWLLSNHDTQRVAAWMRAFMAGEAIDLPPDVVAAIRENGFISASVPDGESGVQGCMRSVYEADGYLLDPHTAVAVAAVKAMVASGDVTGPVVCMGCAHPAKFAETVAEALNLSGKDAAAALPDQEHKCVAGVLKATTGAFSAAAVPCFQLGEDWSAKLRVMVEEVTAKREVTGN